MFSDKWLYNNVVLRYMTFKCRLIAFLAVFGVYYVVVAAVGQYCFYTAPHYAIEEMNIFADITEIDELGLNIIDSNEKDKFSIGLAVKEYRRLKVEFKGEEYYIFAYEFVDENNAYQYCKKYTYDIFPYEEGKNYYFSGETNYDIFLFLHYKHIILQKTKVLRIQNVEGYGFHHEAFSYYVNQKLTESYDLLGRLNVN